MSESQSYIPRGTRGRSMVDMKEMQRRYEGGLGVSDNAGVCVGVFAFVCAYLCVCICVNLCAYVCA